tara:strand:- start:118 stop:1056 length:939 start_codon:yes stop_codon:yes gene_type:complete
MSTLATNKLGTLSGNADMTLPSTRPSATAEGYLDNNGNLTFSAAGATPCEFYVTDAGTPMVTTVYVDSTYNDATPAVGDSNFSNSSNDYFGWNLGLWNLPSAIQSNYLAQANMRWLDLDFTFYNNDDQGGGTLAYFMILNRAGTAHGCNNGNPNGIGDSYDSQGATNNSWEGNSNWSRNTTASGSGSNSWSGQYNQWSSGPYLYQTNSNTQIGQASGRLHVKCAPGAYQRVWHDGYYTYNNSFNYGPNWYFGAKMPYRQNTTWSNSNQYTWGGEFGGFRLNGGGSSTNDANRQVWLTAVLKCRIKPTAVVSS